ncbi:AfsR/SARP family transcriptional regulator [Lentzea sp.]|uniref:AfsR/SARP family transcriptional regulator n=1 Tax=Lentzea sp. TaxID=56099 RepID=UPI002CACC260|nr:BTAD domain-containing putative transcriptional regulator [Lentzea sp.]HUQ56673.1 BTAD domain-containing putative transcriptional regulator [Lentzea sp.]
MRSFGLLGPLDVVLDGRRVHVPPGKRRVVLAALLLRPGQVVGVDELVELAGGSRNALQTAVGRLREDLGLPDLVLTKPGGYVLDVRADEVDVHRFDQLPPREALRLWRGRPFADIGSDALERDHVPALTEKYLVALEARIDGDLREGGHEQLVPELRSLTRRHPTRERMWAQLVVALHRCDRQTEALQAYDDIRRRLADELGLDPGKDLQKAHQQVLTADNRPKARNDLPGDIADFAGRIEDLDEILAAVPSGCVAITAIDGMAGIGKTTLAVRAAHRLASRFPDAQLFVDLHSYTAGVEPRTPSDALLALLTALGVPAQDIPDGLDARAARWRAEMAHRKALVVLDNAGSAAQVRPLLPGTGLVLVTSRRRLVDLDAAHTVSLDVLSEEDSLDLLASIVRRDEDVEDRREIVRLCGYLPLAVRIVGARWRTRPAWSAQDVIRRLTEHRLTELIAGERSVVGAFALSYRQLTAAQQKLFRRLGLHTGEDWDAHLAAAVIGSTRAVAERLLDELLDVHLVQQKENGRYRFHDLLADHAKASVEPEEREEAVLRILDFYLHVASTAEFRMAPGGPRLVSAVRYLPFDPPPLTNSRQALAWMDAERLNLKAAVYLAAYNRHYQHAWQLPHSMSHFLRQRGHGRDRIELQNVALAATHQLGDLKARAEALKGLGSAYMFRSDTTPAKHLHEALELMRQIRDVRGEASVLGLLGIIARKRNEMDKAETYFRRGLTLMRSAGAATGEADALHHLGVVHALRGENDQAMAHIEEALSLYETHDDVARAAATLQDISFVHYNLFDDDECLADLERAIRNYHESGDWRGESFARTDFAHTALELGMPDKALEMARTAVELYRAGAGAADDDEILQTMKAVEDEYGELGFSSALAVRAEIEGDLAEAVRYGEWCLDSVTRWQRRWAGDRVLGMLCRLYSALGDRGTAVRYGEEAVEAAERLRQPRAVAVAKRILARATTPAAPAP